MSDAPNIWFNLPDIKGWDRMTDAERWEAIGPAMREFITTKPNPPGHADYMAAAEKKYPNLPKGAQQAALDCLLRHGAKAAARYAANARARWAVSKFVFKMPKSCTRGICTHNKAELKERLARYRAHMAAGIQAAP